jgi:hypothetical protein
MLEGAQRVKEIFYLSEFLCKKPGSCKGQSRFPVPHSVQQGYFFKKAIGTVICCS